jgi:hypothetical protein
MSKGYLLVEGHGEVGAAGNLIARLTEDRGLPLVWHPPLRWKNLHLRSGIEKGAEHIRRRDDASALLVLRDEDDACPREQGPKMAAWLAELGLPFPSAIVLLAPEYEVLFLPCLTLMAGQAIDGRRGLEPGTEWDGASWVAHRGVKEWLTSHFPPGRSYKPTLDQLPLTRMIDHPTLRSARVPCFGTLERALVFLNERHRTTTPGVYPPP